MLAVEVTQLVCKRSDLGRREASPVTDKDLNISNTLTGIIDKNTIICI